MGLNFPEHSSGTVCSRKLFTSEKYQHLSTIISAIIHFLNRNPIHNNDQSLKNMTEQSTQLLVSAEAIKIQYQIMKTLSTQTNKCLTVQSIGHNLQLSWDSIHMTIQKLKTYFCHLLLSRAHHCKLGNQNLYMGGGGRVLFPCSQWRRWSLHTVHNVLLPEQAPIFNMNMLESRGGDNVIFNSSSLSVCK